MEFFYTILFLLVAIVISNVLSRYIPQVPVPLIQIGLGVIFVLLPAGTRILPENELFMVLFVAPILFYDAKTVSRHELFSNMRSVLLLAFGLVFITVVVIGNFIHWIIPVIPLAAAFALAGLLSPTDAIAVASLEGRISIPHKLMLFLEGESLVNDASGLVAFHFAVAAVITGTFSLKEASVSFLIIAFGGAVIGVIAALVIIRFGFWIRKLGMEDATLHMLIQILTPFLIYILAEEIGVSGILAVVAGGIVYGATKNWTEPVTSQLKIVSGSTWTVLTFVLNGLIFLILGTQIPEIIGTLHIKEHHADAYILLYILAVYTALILFRFIFVLLFWKNNFGEKGDTWKDKLKGSAVLSISAVRGAVTLAAAFSIPLYLSDGTPFPSRDLILLIAAGVILCSLVVSAILLPILLPKKDDDSGRHEDAEKIILNRLIQTAISAIIQKTDETNEAASHKVRIEFEYLKQPVARVHAQDPHQELIGEKTETLVKTGKQAELEMLDKIFAAGEIQKDLYENMKDSIVQRNFYESKIKGTYAKAKHRHKKNIIVWLSRFISLFWHQKRVWEKMVSWQTNVNETGEQISQTYIRAAKSAIHAIEKQIDETNHNVSVAVIRYYHMMIRYFQKGYPAVEDDDYEKMHQLRVEGIQAARDEAQRLFEEGRIDRELLHGLRKSINMFETAIMEQDLAE